MKLILEAQDSFGRIGLNPDLFWKLIISKQVQKFLILNIQIQSYILSGWNAAFGYFKSENHGLETGNNEQRLFTETHLFTRKMLFFKWINIFKMLFSVWNCWQISTFEILYKYSM